MHAASHYTLVSQEPDAEVDARGYPRQAPASEQHLQLCLRSCEAALLSAGQDDMLLSSWALRCVAGQAAPLLTRMHCEAGQH